MASISTRTSTSSKKGPRTKTYRVQYIRLSSDGTQTKTSKSFKTRSEAEEFRARATLAEKQVGGLPDGKKALLWPTSTRQAQSMTFAQFWTEKYVPLYGETNWQPSTYTSHIGIFRNYIAPHLGGIDIREISTETIDEFYRILKGEDAVMMPGKKPHKITKRTIVEIHRILRSAFNQAKKWKIVNENPVTYATPPKHKDRERTVWNDENVAFAIEKCQSLSLNVAINLAVGCTLRMGEITGLTWDNVYVTEESITNATSKIVIDKELARANMESLKILRLQGEGDIQVIAPVFPTTDRKTTLVLKKPKTDSSVREIWVSATLAHLLLELKKERDIQRQRLGSEYFDGNFVICHENGRPCEGNYIRKKFYKLIADAGLPKVDFHSLRHYSVTKKLQLTGGDIKAVQGDSGHAVSKMVTDRCAHISDERRQHTAELFEAGFYTALFGKDSDVQVEALYNSIKGNSVLVEALLQRIQTDKSKKIAKNE